MALSASRLSPDTTISLIRSREWTQEGVLALVTGIGNAYKHRYEENIARIRALDISRTNLMERVERYEGMYDKCPEGYEVKGLKPGRAQPEGWSS